jgi:adenine phosphoribosyltransferase
MNYYPLKICGLTRKLPIVALGPKLSIASFNLLGDGELVEKLAAALARKLKKTDFDYLVGPEVKVVPLLQALSKKTGKPRYVVLRKHIMGYMVKPISDKTKPNLVLNGSDAILLKGKKVVIVDDVISTGRTFKVVRELMRLVNAEVVGAVAVLKQGVEQEKFEIPLFSLGTLPLFRK